MKLVSTAGQRGSYISLSHRWGSGSFTCRTTTDNIDARMKHIGSSLPRTFQNVIHFVRLLGHRLLWIDSLCIIQDGDDGADWRKKAVKMGEYYQYSLLTIGVICPPDSDDGCFPQRYPFVLGQIACLPYRNSKGEHKGFFYVNARPRTIDDDYSDLVLNSNLLQRGWVLQEWLLSRRILFVTQNQLFYECQSRWPVNEFQEEADLKLQAGRITSEIHENWKIPLKPMLSLRTHPVGGLWCIIVETYCTLSLTKPECDTLVAISGIAHEIGKMMTRENNPTGQDIAQACYVAGLWLTDIYHGLLWEQRKYFGDCHLGCEAPTWSWTLHRQPIKWRPRRLSQTPACHVVALSLPDGTTFPVEKRGKGLTLACASDERTNSSQPGHQSPSSFFTVQNSFTTLHISACVKPLLVSRRLTPEEIKHIAQSTSCSSDQLTHAWRAVCDSSRPDRHLGWASIENWAINEEIDERQRIQQTVEAGEQVRGGTGVVLHAMHVLTFKGDWVGMPFGEFAFWNSVCCVIFLVPAQQGAVNGDGNVRGRTYERVGVGRIFKSQVFQGMKKVDVALQ
ncbi:unnamed protein product [Periconia digitata]|uniref:Heterokaryon incompatibility domain-containing protein n=1 Tax=Periconia digitata TaxID=1303443 RepID=A0A9W4UM38_9PLEO|nr:unnamed protein product [Periconia digitata]